MSLGLTVNKKKNGMLLEYIARCIPGVNLVHSRCEFEKTAQAVVSHR